MKSKDNISLPSYGIIDPDYARVYTKIRCTAWGYGYAALMHGSFTRDLDILLVPWVENITITPEHLIMAICRKSKLVSNGHPPTLKPHGRLSFTLMFKEFADPRFIDIGIMPSSVQLIANDNT